MRDSYLLLNPHYSGAVPYVHAMSYAFGMLPICIYTDPKSRFYCERDVIGLPLPEVAEEIELESLDELESVIADLRQRYNIRTMLPWGEPCIEPASRILPLLDCDWMPGEELKKFRDKQLLRESIRSRAPHVRVPDSRIVRSIEDVFAHPLPDHFVIKPNNGMGSLNVEFFRPDDRTAIAAHLAKRTKTWILEERIDGPEYRINGLIRRNGTLQILYMGAYHPCQISDTVTFAYAAETQLKTSDPEWPMLAEYTQAVLTATRLRGSPFHLEVKVDDRGPALLDLGARQPSDGGAWMMSMLHPERPDSYATACRDFVGDNDFAMDPPNYRFYDSGRYIQLCGLSDDEGVLCGINGMERVEAMPEFLRWIVRPRIGDRISKTVDLATCSYIAAFRHDGERERTAEIAQQVNDAVELALDPKPRPWSQAQITRWSHRVGTRVAWAAKSRGLDFASKR